MKVPISALNEQNIQGSEKAAPNPLLAVSAQAQSIKEHLPDVAKFYTDGELALAWHSFCTFKRGFLFEIFIDDMFPGKRLRRKLTGKQMMRLFPDTFVKWNEKQLTEYLEAYIRFIDSQKVDMFKFVEWMKERNPNMF